MKFSIIVPVYNTEKYIVECLDSVVNQTFKDFECVLVDDGSTDNSSTICDNYAKKYSHFKIFHNRNSGQLLARKFGIDNSSGEYLLFLDSDDVLNIKALEILNSYLLKYNADMVSFSYKRFVCGLPVVEDICKEPKFINNLNDLFAITLSNQYNNSMCNKAVRRSLIKEVDYEKYKTLRNGEDLLQVIDIIKCNPKTIIIENCLYFYRKNPTSVTLRKDINSFVNDHVVLVKKIYNEVLNCGILNDISLIKIRTYRKKLLVGMFRRVVLWSNDNRQRIRFFKLIKSSEYYSNFIASKKVDKLPVNYRLKLFLFDKNCFNLLILYIKLSEFIHNLGERK